MVVYEVNLHVDADVAGAYRDWLGGHVRAILEIEGFVGATLYEQEAAPDGRRHFTVHYRLRDRPSLDAYLRDHAARMREEGLARFGSRFSADRRVLVAVEAFGG
jgi:quinol monooxygenase YgiN